MNAMPALLLLAALLPAGGGATQAEPPPHPAMRDDTIPTTTVEDAHLSLRVEFHFDAGHQVLRVRYLLNNKGKTAVALFDRGDSVAVAQGKLKAGMAGPVTSEQGKDGLSLNHRALPLRKPAPTVPPVPLAARVIAGGQLGGDVLADTGDAARVRYCLGYAPFDTTLFSSPQPVDGVDLWRASFDVVGTQKLLCTPWFDTAQRAFVSH